MSAHEFHHCEHTPLGPPPIDTAEQIRQATAEGEKVGAMPSEHLRTTPTPIDPADIRPGDVLRVVREVTCSEVTERGTIIDTDGRYWLPDAARTTWHLVHRPDPDAEVIEAMAKVLPTDGVVHGGIKGALADLRRLGFDVVRRAES